MRSELMAGGHFRFLSMKTSKSLPGLTSWMLRQIEERQRDIETITMPPELPGAAEISFLLMDIHNKVATFLRAYCLSSLAGAYMANGSRVNSTTGIQGHRSALTFAIQTERPRNVGIGPWEHRDEPTWHDPNVIIRILNKAGCSNAVGVNDALSIGSGAFVHLTTARNFLAHRSESTALRLRSLGGAYGLPLSTDPLAVVFGIGHGRPQGILEDWLDDIATIVSLFPR